MLDKSAKIYVAGHNGLGEVRSPADDVVLAVFYLTDECSTFCILQNSDPVAYGNGVGTADSLQTEISFNFAFNLFSAVCFYNIPASGVLYY